MKFKKILALCLLCSILSAAAACSTLNSNTVSSGSISSAAVTASAKASSLKDDSSESATITAIKIAHVTDGIEADAIKYDAGSELTVYQINDEKYININDASSLLHKKITYDQTSNRITIGDSAQASADFYMPDLSAYPNLDEVIDLPPYGVRADSDVTDFKFLTKGVQFKDIMKKIDKRLKSDGFTAASEKQYTELTNSLSKFKQGEMKNTYVKYGSNKEEYAIQLIDGGLDKNKIPIVIVRMKAKSECAEKDQAETESSSSSSASGVDAKTVTVKGSGITADKINTIVQYYDFKANAYIYKISGNLYLDFDDVSNWFKTEFTCEPAKQTISIDGNVVAQANALYYMPDDLSAYPNLEDITGFPPYEVWTDECTSGGVIDYKYAVKDKSFQIAMEKISAKLKSKGFNAATKKQYENLTVASGISAFKQGKIENTYVKYKNSKEDFNPETIQIIDGGSDKNKMPIIVVKLLS